MSREDFSDFIHAVEHSTSLRAKLKICINQQEILELAAKYGFTITNKDLEEDKEADKIYNWFKINKILPIRRQ